MTGPCSKSITPDGLSGMIFAMEGIKNAIVLLNGPMGCKFYHSTTSQFLALRPPLYLPASDGGEKVPVDYNFLNNWFFRQPRVPCTWLDGYDYVYGTADKVRDGLCYLREHVNFELLAIVNSPGASLIGDNLEELVRETLPDCLCVMLESPGYSTDFCTGYETALMELFRQVGSRLWNQTARPDRASRQKSVNLLGLSVWQRYWEGDLAELKRLFTLCGITVNCCPAAQNSLEELRRLPAADLNVVVFPEMASRAAAFLQDACGTPYYICPGPPAGFSQTEEIFSEICRILRTDVTPLITESERARALSWSKIDGVHQMFGLPDAALFAVSGSLSQVFTLRRFFMEYLGMIPDCLEVTEGNVTALRECLKTLLQEHKAGQPEQKDILETRAELVFADGNTIAALKTRQHPFCGIEISQPGMGYTDVLPKTQMGIRGSLFLVEQVLNGLMTKL
ncbi:MAG: nitrogenase component 1 [Lachnospiraceae bacterium]|nr:nitrogenase component 1 [Lachnospiraceae bacterium]